MLKFETEVRLRSDASSLDAFSRISQLTAPAFSFGKQQRAKPLRGKITETGGSIRWPLNEYRFVSPRTLHFNFVDAPDGARLRGIFRVWTAMRVVALSWLFVAGAIWLFQFGMDLYHRRPAPVLLQDIFMILVANCMALGYVWMAVRVGRSRDDSLVKVLKLSLRSADGALAVRELLTQNQRPAYIDED